MIVTQNQLCQTMTIDIRLCGNLTRKQINDTFFEEKSKVSAENTPNRTNSPATNLNQSCAFAAFSVFQSLSFNGTCVEKSAINTKGNQPQSLSTMIHPPVWAEPAKGEARLEPVFDSTGKHTAIDLSLQSSYRVGRAPNSDILLLHTTSSRRHAILFHHSNGSCYVVDCGSAHGTFVNGRRVSSPSTSGLVIPHKVRRGAILRFGGPGAPCYILKSFSFKLEEINSCTLDSTDMGIIVQRNTRFNSLGLSAMKGFLADFSLGTSSQDYRKRSNDSLESDFTFDDIKEGDHCSKRIRCSSPPLLPEEPIRLVSPDFISVLAMKPRHVTFSPDPPQTFYDTMEVDK